MNLQDVPEKELHDEFRRRQKARNDAELREKALAAEMRRAEQARKDEQFAARYGLTAGQLEEIADYLRDREEQAGY